MITIIIQCSMCGKQATASDTGGDYENFKKWRHCMVEGLVYDPELKHYCSPQCRRKADRKGVIFGQLTITK